MHPRIIRQASDSRRGAASRLNLGLTVLPTAALAALFLTSCPQESPPPSRGGESTNSTELEPVPTRPSLAFRVFDEGLPVGGTWRGYPSLLDFTGDGHLDIVVSNREEDGWNAWQYMGTDKAWERRIEGLARNLFYGGQDGADLDGDGFLDLILSSHTLGLQVYLNKEGKMEWENAGHDIETPSMLLDVCCANFDGDDQTDLVGIGHFNGGLNIYLGKGGGEFQRLKQSSDLIGSERAFGMQVEVVDLDGDGDDDILSATHKGLKVFFTEQEADGLSWNEFSDNLPRPEIGNSMRGLFSGDFNGDGQPEIGWCALKDPKQAPGSVGYLGIFEWNAEERNWTQIDRGLDPDAAFMEAKAADFNNDGNLDLIVCDTARGPLIYLGDGKAGFTLKGGIDNVHGKSKLDVGDIDGDGYVDILVSLQQQKGGVAEGGVWTLLNSKEIWED